jgi:selenide,water dikinase
MTTLNKKAADIIRGEYVGTTGHVGTGASPVPAQRSGAAFTIHAMTDITGFGLIGHAREMVLASNVAFHLHANEISILPGAIECVRAGYIPGGLNNNRNFAECVVEYESAISDELKALLFDPQTAGGLLISVAAADSVPLLNALQTAGVPARRIGEVVESAKPLIRIY